MASSDEDTSAPDVYSLYDSIRGFAPPKIVANLSNGKEAAFMVDCLHNRPNLDDPSSKVLSWFKEIVKAFFVGWLKGRVSKVTVLFFTIQCHQDLIQGRFVGIGHRMAPDEHKVREVIPTRRWRTRRIKWNMDTLECDDVTYTEIVVTHPERVATVIGGGAKTKRAGPKTRGRPTRKAEILEAYKAIDKDFSDSMVSHFSAIREKAKELSGNSSDDGLGNDAIRKIVVERWKTDKSKAEKL